MSVRAGIVVTGTEVLSGRVADRNGPWLAEQLRELGVDLAHTSIVGDRPKDMLAALQFMADQGMGMVLTSGGLGPTADDLTAEVVGEFQGRAMVLDQALEQRMLNLPLLSLRSGQSESGGQSLGGRGNYWLEFRHREAPLGVFLQDRFSRGDVCWVFLTKAWKTRTPCGAAV